MVSGKSYFEHPHPLWENTTPMYVSVVPCIVFGLMFASWEMISKILHVWNILCLQWPLKPPFQPPLAWSVNIYQPQYAVFGQFGMYNLLVIQATWTKRTWTAPKRTIIKQAVCWCKSSTRDRFVSVPRSPWSHRRAGPAGIGRGLGRLRRWGTSSCGSCGGSGSDGGLGTRSLKTRVLGFW